MAERTRTTDVAAAAEAALRSAAGLRATVIVVSDEVASGADTDRGGHQAIAPAAHAI